MPYSSGGRPVTALSPTFGMSKSRNFHASVPSAHVLDPRRDVLVLRGQVVLEHVGRLDDVVVDADQDHVVHAHAAEHTRADMRG